MHIGNLLNRLQGVKRNSAGWMARCPAHEDKNPSLAIAEEDGKILIHCHAGCATEDVLNAIGLYPSDLFVDSNGKRIEAEYGYLDESGRLLFEVVRYNPKDFRQRRPDGKGGWIWNLEGVRRVLYNLPEVARAKSVLIVEGEKDVLMGSKLGLTATCNPGGAGKWRDDYSRLLKGKQVAIIADADAPGVAHARTAAQSLIGVAESVKLIEALPGVGVKDLSDFAAQFTDREAECREVLLALMHDAPELTLADLARWQPVKSAGGIVLTELSDLISEPEEQVSWLWDGILPTGGLSLLGAKPKTGKSTLARCLALAVASGQEFLGRKTQQGTVMYLALEEKRSGVRKHFQAMGWCDRETAQQRGWAQILVHVAHAPKDALTAVAAKVKEHKPALLIIDPLLRFARVKDVSDYAEVTLALEPLLVLARENNVHVLMVHHLGKGERADVADAILGSTAFRAAVDSNLIMRRSERYRTLQTEQRYGQDLEEIVLAFDKETGRLSVAGTRFEADVNDCEKHIIDFLKDADEPQSRSRILKAIEGRATIVVASLKALVDAGRVIRSGDGTRGRPNVYALAEGN
jgi:KaiC/GvpD/RAD55 family RecA-like ATPase